MRREKIVIFAFFMAVAFMSYNVLQRKDRKVMSDLLLANVEALAQGESGGNVYCCGNYGTCMLILGGGEVKGIKFYTPCP